MFVYEFRILWVFLIFLTVIYFICLRVFLKFFIIKSHSIYWVEILWTWFPRVVLLWLIFPTLKATYEIEGSPTRLIKERKIIYLRVVAHQWYWEFTLPQIKFSPTLGIFNLFLLEDMELGVLRNSLVRDQVVLPYLYPIKFLITSADVIHSLSIPGLGVKVDSFPGQINSSVVIVYYPCVVNGYCAEFCGVNNSWMPFELHFIRFVNFLTYSFLKTK